MRLLDDVSNIFIALSVTGGGVRLAIIFIKIMSNEEHIGQYKSRIKNTIIFVILASTIFTIKQVALKYYK